MKNIHINFDANATSSLRTSAQAVLSCSEMHKLGNASSVHSLGRHAKKLIRSSRQQLLSLIQASSEEAEIVFTSGGTEANHLMLDGLLGGLENSSRFPAHIVVSSIEHAAMREPIGRLTNASWEVTEIQSDANGFVSPTAFREAIRPNTALVSCMYANNELGTIQDITRIASSLRQDGYQGLIVCDAIQALGKTSFNASELFASGVDALSLSGHKIGAPSGIGAVVFSKNSELCRSLTPYLLGGPQEGFRRAGTENSLGIISFGAVAEEVKDLGVGAIASMRELREVLAERLFTADSSLVRLSATDDRCLSNTLCIAVPGLRGDDLVVALDLRGLASSTGAACSSGKQSRSHVIDQLPIDEDLKDSVLRLSLDWSVERDEVEHGAALIAETIAQMRNALGTSETSLDAGRQYA